MTITLKNRTGSPELVHEDTKYAGPPPDVLIYQGAYFVRAGVSEGRALYLSATVETIEEANYA